MPLFSGKCLSQARLAGKTALVTGSNTGIGRITVEDFYKRGAKVIMACRSVEKAGKTAEEIREACKNQENLGEISVVELDLMSLKSVRKCAQEVLQKVDKLNLLVNNAGVMLCPEGRTEDGFETQFGTNHLGHFLLTLLLLPKIVKSGPARIVNVSSMAHEQGKVDFDDLNWEKKPYSSLQAYQQSKLCNVLFSRELAKRLKENGIEDVKVYSLHPGVINTELGRHLGDTYNRFLAWVFQHMANWFFKTPEQGAQTTIYCAVDEQCAQESGLYYSDCVKKTPSKAARNDEDAKRLWEESLKMVKHDANPFVV